MSSRLSALLSTLLRRVLRPLRGRRWLRRLGELSPEIDYVFVVTFGRSGSTLVQGLLNAMPATLVRGENGFYPLHLYRATRAGAGFARKYGEVRPHDPASAFYGLDAVRRDDFVRTSRALMSSFLLADTPARGLRRLGFKEVRWHQIEPEETEPFFRWLDELCPGARFVLNTREQEAALGSGFWQHQERDEALARMNRVLEIHEHLTRTRPDRVFVTRFEELTSKDPAVVDGVLTGLATFATGSCDDALLATLRQTLTVGHGPNPFGKSRQDTAGTAGRTA